MNARNDGSASLLREKVGQGLQFSTVSRTCFHSVFLTLVRQHHTLFSKYIALSGKLPEVVLTSPSTFVVEYVSCPRTKCRNELWTLKMSSRKSSVTLGQHLHPRKFCD